MTTPPTILALKQTFLEQETRRLAQPLVPSRAWQRANRERRQSSRRLRVGDEAEAEGGGSSGVHAAAGRSAPKPLPERAVDDALFRTNQLLRQHARRVYASQAVRHVAEQLDQLYWQASERAVPADDGDEGGQGGQGGRTGGGLDVFRRGADYADPDIVAALPAAWEDAREAEAMAPEARRYAELVAQLQDLSARRTAAEARVRRLRQLAAMVAPFDQTGGQDGQDGQGTAISRQDNVVTRDGPIERELERMRVLLARVGDRVDALQRDKAAGQAEDHGRMRLDEDDVEAAAQRRTRALLEQF